MLVLRAVSLPGSTSVRSADVSLRKQIVQHIDLFEHSYSSPTHLLSNHDPYKANQWRPEAGANEMASNTIWIAQMMTQDLSLDV
jgi:hypothetical protein